MKLCYQHFSNKYYSKVPPLRNCIIRNAGLISLNKIPLYKKLPRLIHTVRFLIQLYIAILQGVYLNMSPKGLNSLEKRMKVSSPNCYNFKKPSVLAQTIRSSHNSSYFKKVFLTILTAVWSIKVFLIPWYTDPVLKKNILT